MKSIKYEDKYYIFNTIWVGCFRGINNQFYSIMLHTDNKVFRLSKPIRISECTYKTYLYIHNKILELSKLIDNFMKSNDKVFDLDEFKDTIIL